MILNSLERLFITSPIRPLIQRYFEARQLLKMGGRISGATALEVGCGPGSGIDLIYQLFDASDVDAFDMDHKMVMRVKRQEWRKNRLLKIWVGNVRNMPVESDRYDAVFNFGVIHHVVNWRAALSEIHRVLKPGGKFYCEEIHSRYITHPIFGKLMKHPQIDRFDDIKLISALKEIGFKINSCRQMADLYIWVVATK